MATVLSPRSQRNRSSFYFWYVMLEGLTELPLYLHPPRQISSARVFLHSWCLCWFALCLAGWIFFVLIVFVEGLGVFLVGFLFVLSPKTPVYFSCLVQENKPPPWLNLWAQGNCQTHSFISPESSTKWAIKRSAKVLECVFKANGLARECLSPLYTRQPREFPSSNSWQHRVLISQGKQRRASLTRGNFSRCHCWPRREVVPHPQEQSNRSLLRKLRIPGLDWEAGS